MVDHASSSRPGAFVGDWKMDALVLGGLVFICTLGMVLIGRPAAPYFSDVNLQATIKAPDVSPMPEQRPETSENYSAPAPASRTIQFPAPASTYSAPTLPRIVERTWGAIEPSSKSAASGEAFITLLGDGLNPDMFRAARTNEEAGFHGGQWDARNVESNAAGTRLILSKKNGLGRYSMGEMKTRQDFGYGRYEAIMRPASGSGTVSSFFTYTGPHRNMPHDEIDIEFLGADTTRVHFNYFKNGKRGTPVTYDLPFDAAEAEHLYVFEWYPDKIIWLIDGETYHITELGDAFIPSHAGQIYVNLWTGVKRMQDWHGKPDFGDETTASYSCISFTPLGETSRSCSSFYRPNGSNE